MRFLTFPILTLLAKLRLYWCLNVWFTNLGHYPWEINLVKIAINQKKNWKQGPIECVRVFALQFFT